MLSLNNDGVVILAGVYQLFPIKQVLFYGLAGVASVLSYLLTSKEKTLMGVIDLFAIGVFVAFFFDGALSDIFGKTLTGWMCALLGFCANSILRKLLNSTDNLTDALFSFFYRRYGIEDDMKKDKEGKDDAPKSDN